MINLSSSRTSEMTNFSKSLCVVFQLQLLVHMVRFGVFQLFLLHTFHGDSLFLHSHCDKDQDDAKASKAKTRLANYVFDNTNVFWYRSVH